MGGIGQAGTPVTLGDPRLIQVEQVTEAVGKSNELDDGRRSMSLEDVSCKKYSL